MKIFNFIAVVTLLGAVAVVPNTVFAQTPAPPPPPPWTGSAGAGLALTQGNSDTSTVNAAYEVKRETTSPYVFKSSGLLVYGQSEGELTSDRLALGGRIERKLSERTALFGQVQYLRDSFKEIDYLISPTVGISRILLKNDRSVFDVDGAVGMLWEQNPGLELQTDGAVSGGQRFAHKLTATTEFTQRLLGLWKMDDFGDALYTFSAGLAANITAGTQLKVELLDTYKTRPPSIDVKENDVAMLVSFVFKFD